jgi:hypothetical protein
MSLLTDELAGKVMDKDLRKLIGRIRCIRLMAERARLNIENGRIEDAIDCVEEQLRDLEDIRKMIDEAQVWENAHRLMGALQGMGFDIKTIEVKKR